MQIVEISKIIIAPNRQRKTFSPEALAELEATIGAQGLLHAVVVREAPEGLVLVAGESRLKAIVNLQMLGGQLRYDNQNVPDGFVPYVTLGQLSELEAEEAELSENATRTDLTWQESAAAMARLHSLRSRQAQAAGRIHTVADTAMETKGRSDGSYQAAVRKDLIVAQHLSNPEVAKAKTADEAFKILKRQEIQQKNVQLAAAVGKTFTKSVHQVINANCLDWMAAADPGLFDVILTDPPYGMGADAFGDGGGGRLSNNEHHYKDDYESWKGLMEAWAPLAFKVAKAEAHAYVFCDLDNYHELKRIMQSAGWYVFRTPFICTKPNSGRVPLPDQGPRRQWEMILYAIKGKKKTTAIYPDVITTFADPGLGHGAQKPVALFDDLLKRSVRPGDSVLDCFAGSGTIFPAAHNHKVKATGIELNPEYYGICLKRVEELDKVLTPATASTLDAELKSMFDSALN